MHGGDSLPLRDRLRAWVDHLDHVLPAQAPIRDFVHHNTLHGFQHLPFADGLAAARDLTGAAVYLPEGRWHELYGTGRITDDDLAAALDDAGIADLDAPVIRGLTRRDVLLASLLEPGEPPAPAALAWELRERGVADADLWAACRELHAPPPAAAGDAAWEREAATAWGGLVKAVGHRQTLRSLLEHLTGEDILEAVRTILQRHLAAHLDLAVAAWRNPARAAGFYAAWRASVAVDFTWELDDLPHVRDEIAWLPADPLDCLVEELSRLLPDEELWFGYLERLALDLPGWSGMFLWRDRHPEVGDGTPVAMLDYLAVRVLLERLIAEDRLRRLTGAPMDFCELAGYFAANPAEFHVRHAWRRGVLAEDLAQRAESLIHAADGQLPPPAAWTDLARAIAARGAGTPEPAAWLLFRLARRLGVGAADLRHIGGEGAAALAAVAASLDPLARGQIWLLAFEGHYREQIFAALAANHGRHPGGAAPTAQVVFCMDDREEGTRRHLEEIAPAVHTYGAAGFFGIAVAWQGLDDVQTSALCPVVVRPVHRLDEAAQPGAEKPAADRARRRARRLSWRQRLVQAPRRHLVAGPLLSALAGPLALAALTAGSLAPGWFGEALARWRESHDGRVATRVPLDAPADSPPGTPAAPRPGFTDAEQADRVEAFLRGIGLTAGFAPLVVMLGHGSSSRNNPHLAAYDCGACSGRHGGPNARVFAALANRPAVRARLAGRGIAIPEGTWFLGAEHNTCDDGIDWCDVDQLPSARQADFARLAGELAAAGRAHAAERCRRFANTPPRLSPEAGHRQAVARRHDTSQARPELGHATNAAAFVGRRAMSRGLFLDRRVFLVSYDPEADGDGAIVEAILLAVGPVGAGISLEYYFSTVDNERFGCASKITHNLTGGFGVMEGADSDLRTGLPRQMIEVHEAMRLLLVVEQAPVVLSAVLSRQPALQELVANAWIILAAQDPHSGALSRYCPRRGWLPWTGRAVLPRVARSVDWYGGQRDHLPPALLLGGGQAAGPLSPPGRGELLPSPSGRGTEGEGGGGPMPAAIAQEPPR